MGKTNKDLIESSSQKGHILAAGAILWRKEPFVSEIAIIHRKRYEEEWCLPKGKMNPGESLEATAKREVLEETGCTAEIVRFGAVTSYDVDEKTKQVFYYHMKVIDESKWDKRDKEVDQIVWLPVAEAIRILSHADQKRILAELHIPKVKRKTSSRFRIYKSARFRRLEGTIIAYRTELEYRRSQQEVSQGKDPFWYETAMKLLSDSEQTLNSGDIDVAWKCFHAAQRMEIYSLDTEQLLIKSGAIRNEAAKFGGWREKAISELLDKEKMAEVRTKNKKEESLTIVREMVYQASLLRDDSYNNQGHKDELFKEHISFLAIAVILCILAMTSIWVTDKKIFTDLSKNIVTLSYCFLFGMLGAIFSAALKLQTTSKSSRIPEMLNNRYLTTLRIFVGGISAFIIDIFIRSQFVINMFDIDPLKSVSFIYSLYFIAFASGFSERFVLNTINTVTRETGQEKPK